MKKRQWFIGVLKKPLTESPHATTLRAAGITLHNATALITRTDPAKSKHWFQFGIGPFDTMIGAVRHARFIGLKI